MTNPDHTGETKVADDLVEQLLGIQEDLPNEDDRAALGFAVHELRKLSALRAQLTAAEAEQPIAWIYYYDDGKSFGATFEQTTKQNWVAQGKTIIALYKSPRAAEARLKIARKAQQTAELQSNWLRWGIEEIIRCTEPKAGNGDRFICQIATEAFIAAGFDLGSAGIQKPERSLKPDGGGK